MVRRIYECRIFFEHNNNAGVISARLRPLVAVKDITVGTGRKMAGELSRSTVRSLKSTKKVGKNHKKYFQEWSDRKNARMRC